MYVFALESVEQPMALILHQPEPWKKVRVYPSVCLSGYLSVFIEENLRKQRRKHRHWSALIPFIFVRAFPISSQTGDSRPHGFFNCS